MHFSAFLTTRSAGPEEDGAVIDAMIDHARDVESKGFDAVFLPDHHFTGYAPPCSDPFVFAAFLAGQLGRLHFGFSVQTVPLHNPVRFAERLALLDQLTKGKLLVGVGSGTTPEEMIGLGVNFQEASALAQSNLEIIEDLWAKKADDPVYSFDNGKYKGDIVSRIVPAPYTKPRPRMMSVALRPSSVQRAATMGQPAFITTFTPPDLASTNPFEHVSKHFASYKEAIVSSGHSVDVVDAALEWTSVSFQYIHVAETDEQARAELDELIDEYQESVEREHVANKKAETISGIELRDPPNARTEGWKRTWCLWGSPETVARQLIEYQDLGIGNVLGGFLGGPLTARRKELSDQSLRLFTEQVIPSVQAADLRTVGAGA